MDVDNANQLIGIDANALQKIINEQNSKMLFLTKDLEQKDGFIQKLIQEKDVLESDKKKIQIELRCSIRDKENIVIRFAVVEKNVLDLKETLESSEREKRKILKEYDLLNEKLKLAKDEKLRTDMALEAKSQEHKSNIRYIERLKNEISSLETKYKWNTLKLKQEMNNKQVNQITMENNNAVKNKKIVELEQTLEVTSRELKGYSQLLENNKKKEKNLEEENLNFKENILKLQGVIAANMSTLEELQVKTNNVDAIISELALEQHTNSQYAKQLKELENKIDDHVAVIVEYNEKESNLLKLNAELSTLNAQLKNELSLHKSKTLALMLDNECTNKTKVEYACFIQNLKNDLETVSRNRSEERLIMAKHLAEQSKEIINLQSKLEQAHADAKSNKKKTFLLIKDLQQEMAILHRVHIAENKSSNIINYSTNCGKIEHSFHATDIPTARLIKRIIRLQHSNNHSAGKDDFLENHS